ncbi:molecular chaperone DjiA [Pseudorhodobacter sp.]|uniref:molecular chaperone DjiA n=1 Tax=Pseudorhodobacter sp. TaxID=1934400 RepID=UPI002AFF4ABB|nr:molecular chaperone DjiA [Pseudorhodobacter sp.]
MSIWTRINDVLSALASGEGLAAVFERLRGFRMRTPERSVGFTIAVIALGAKMAKADGKVTRDEVAAFRQLFAIAPEEEANAARIFNLARQDVAGFDAYARKIADMFPDEGRQTLIDLLEGLFTIAMADGEYHPNEDLFLSEVAQIFGLGDPCFRSLRARFVEDLPRNPYDVLGVPPDASQEVIRAAWKQAVRDSHPDRLIARGVPLEAVKLASRRMADINAAWKELNGKRAA